MSAKNTMKAIPLTSIDSATFLGAYLQIGTGLPVPCSLLMIINDSTVAITISYDGVTDNDYLVTKTQREINAQSNALPPGYTALFPAGMPIWVKGVAGVGLVYVVGYYTSQGA